MSTLADLHLPDPPPADRFLTKDGGVIHAHLGRHILDLGNIHQLGDGTLVWYQGGVYCRDGDRRAKRAITDALGKHYKRSHLDGAMAWIRAQAPHFPDLPPEDRINVRNGLLCWKTGTLHPHTPEFLSLVQIPVDWNPEARCPAIFAFLEEVWPEDAFNLFFEIAGYCLLPRILFKQAATLLQGGGDNGKSVIIALFIKLLGIANVSNHSLHYLSENRFARADLQGRLLNCCGDLDARSVQRSDLFKQITGGDRIQAERKGKDSFSFDPYCKLLYSANEPPLSRDQSDAYFQRWIVVSMDRTIPVEKQDARLIEKLTCKTELQGLLWCAVEGLRQLVERGRFVLPQSVEEAREAYRERLDTVAAFLTESCEMAPTERLNRNQIYQSYRRYCEREGRLPVSAAAFYKRVSAWAPERVRLATIGGRRLIIGLKVIDDASSSTSGEWKGGREWAS